MVPGKLGLSLIHMYMYERIVNDKTNGFVIKIDIEKRFCPQRDTLIVIQMAIIIPNIMDTTFLTFICHAVRQLENEQNYFFKKKIHEKGGGGLA